MTEATRNLLDAFDALAEPERQEVVAALLRRALFLKQEQPEEIELVEAADHAFQELEELALVGVTDISVDWTDEPAPGDWLPPSLPPAHAASSY